MDSIPVFSPDELRRYTSHFELEGFGEMVQKRLKVGKVLVVGLGGQGSAACMYLAAAGVGLLGLVDPNRIQVDKIHRQILYGEQDHGEMRPFIAEKRLKTMNSHVQTESFAIRVDPNNAADMVSDFDVVLDCTNSPASQKVLSAVCANLQVPHVLGTCSGWHGLVATFWVPYGPVMADLASRMPVQVPGSFGPVSGMVGVMQAMEAVKMLGKIGDPLIGRALSINMLTGKIDDFAVLTPRAVVGEADKIST